MPIDHKYVMIRRDVVTFERKRRARYKNPGRSVTRAAVEYKNQTVIIRRNFSAPNEGAGTNGEQVNTSIPEHN